MNKFLFVFLIFLTEALGSFAQYNQWTWMAGDSVSNKPAVYGTQGTAAPANTPSGFWGASEWQGNDNCFYLFYGESFTFNKHHGEMWKYDPATNQWTWLNGSQTPNAVANYGAQGAFNSTNHPGSRGGSSFNWTDKNGKMWLYGGTDTLNQPKDDLWQYDPATNQWAWIKGSQLNKQIGVYGTKGISSPLNHPPGLTYANCNWVDKNGDLWMYGGGGYDVNNVWGRLSCVWKYSIATNEWTWMAGTNTYNEAPNYGTKNVASATNTPGARWESKLAWVDSAGNFWTFGGQIGTTWEHKNDMWKYDPVTNMWTWISGTNAADGQGTYGTLCNSSTNNVPAARRDTKYNWTDDCGNFWFFGGFSVEGFSTVKTYNDMWMYDVANNTWKWINGPNTGNSTYKKYGTKGVSSPTNMPPPHDGGTAYRIPSKNEFWIMGGSGQGGYMNDVWKYTPDKPTASFSYASVSSNCGDTIKFTNTSIPGCNKIKSFAWDFDDASSGINNTSTQANPVHYFSSSGTFQVKLIVINCTGSTDTLKQSIQISGGLSATLTSTPTACGSSNGSATAVVSGGSGFSYTWSGSASTQTTSIVTGLPSGIYTVVISDAGGCSYTDTVSVAQSSNLQLTASSTPINCSATTGTATANPSAGTSPYTYSWTNNTQTTSTITGLIAGTYTVTITDKSSCTKSTTVSITQTNNTLSLIPSSASSTCKASDGTATIGTNGGTTPYTYIWQNNTQTTATITGLDSATYYVTVSDKNGCTKTATVSVSKKSNTAQLTTSSFPAGCTTNNGSANINAIGGNGPLTYSWSNGETTASISGLAPTDYTVTVTDADGCTKTATTSVTSPSNQINLIPSSTDELCASANGTASISANGGTTPYTYSWSRNAETTQAINNLSSGIYTVLVTDKNSCSKTTTISIQTLSGSPFLTTSDDTNLVSSAPVVLTASGGLSYTWSSTPTSTMSCTNCANPTVTPIITTSYTVIATDNNGCTESNIITIYVEQKCGDLFIPTAFSPNNDGVNDVFKIRGKCLKDFSLQIFSRWGEKVFETNDMNTGWDGQYSGTLNNSNVFLFVLKAQTKTGELIDKKGNVTLVR